MNRLILPAMLASFVTLFVSCDFGPSSPLTDSDALESPAVKLPELSVETNWLAAHSTTESLIVIDARPREAYIQGHIPGAINLPTDLTFDVERSNKLPIVPKLEKLLGDLGIGNQDSVIVYDNGNLRGAARILWMLAVHGQQQVAVLAGGYDRWTLENRAVSSEPVSLPAKRFVANVSPQHIATKLQVRKAVENPQQTILDVRSPVEYRGQEDRWPRNGHIKNAVNFEWSGNLETQGSWQTLKSPEQLQDLYSDYSDSRVIAYCTRGRRAAVSYLALRLAGIDAAVYDGSWTEWSGDPDLPIAVD